MTLTVQQIAIGAVTAETYADHIRGLGVPESWVNRLSAAPTDDLSHCFPEDVDEDAGNLIVDWHVWSRTPEGHDFWSGVRETIRAAGIDKGFSQLGTYEEAIAKFKEIA